MPAGILFSSPEKGPKMDIRSWLLCFPIRWMLNSLARELEAPSPGTRWRTFLDRHGPHWTLTVQESGRPVLEIDAGPGASEGRIVVNFRAGPLEGKSYHVSSRHPAHDIVFRLTRAHRDAEADAPNLN